MAKSRSVRFPTFGILGLTIAGLASGSRARWARSDSDGSHAAMRSSSPRSSRADSSFASVEDKRFSSGSRSISSDARLRSAGSDGCAKTGPARLMPAAAARTCSIGAR